MFYNIALPLPVQKQTIKFILFQNNINDYPQCEHFELNIFIETSINVLDSILMILKNSNHKSCQTYGLFTLGLSYIRFAQENEFLCNVLDYNNNIIVGTVFSNPTPTPTLLTFTETLNKNQSQINDKQNCFFVNQFIDYCYFDKLVTIDELLKDSVFKQTLKKNVFKNLKKYFTTNLMNLSTFILGTHYVGLPFLLNIPKNCNKNQFFIWIYQHFIKHIKNTLRICKTLEISLYPFSNFENYTFKIIAILSNHQHIVIDKSFKPFLIEHIIGFGVIWEIKNTITKSTNNFFDKAFKRYNKICQQTIFYDHPVFKFTSFKQNTSCFNYNLNYSKDSINLKSNPFKYFNIQKSNIDIINNMQLLRSRKFDCYLQNCIEQFFNEKIVISGRLCSKCNQTFNSDTTEKLAIAPKILTIQLKRFNYQDGGKKTNVNVFIPKM